MIYESSFSDGLVHKQDSVPWHQPALTAGLNGCSLRGRLAGGQTLE